MVPGLLPTVLEPSSENPKGLRCGRRDSLLGDYWVYFQAAPHLGPAALLTLTADSPATSLNKELEAGVLVSQTQVASKPWPSMGPDFDPDHRVGAHSPQCEHQDMPTLHPRAQSNPGLELL